MNEITLLKFKETDSKEARNSGNVWFLHRLEYPIESMHFEFWIRLEKPKYDDIGVITEKCALGRSRRFSSSGVKNFCWGWECCDCSSHKNKTKFFNGNSSGQSWNLDHPNWKDKDLVKVIVNRLEKKMYLGFNDEDVDKYKVQNINIPEKDVLYIACSLSKNYSVFEFEKFIDHDSSPYFKVSKINEDEKERIDHVIENGEFKIALASKDMPFWKSFLHHSNIENLGEIEEYRGFANMDLSLDEEIIVKLIMNKEHEEIRYEYLPDYFLFFNHLGMKREALIILDKIHKTKEVDFTEVFENFKKFCLKNENENVKSWFSKNPKLDEEISFDYSLSLSYFNELRKKEKELCDGNESLLSIPFVPNIAKLFRTKYKEPLESFKHKDFGDMDLEKLKTFQQFKELRGGKLSNMVVKTADNMSFPAHREILFWSTNFFFRMIRFQGKEFEDLQERNLIQLIDIDEDMFRNILDYIYTGEVETETLHILIECIIFCEKYQELTMMKKFIHKLEFCLSKRKISKEEVKEYIRKSGYILKDNDNVKFSVIPLMTGFVGLKKEEVERLIQLSYSRRENTTKFSELEKKIVELRSQSQRSDEKLEEAMKKIDAMGKENAILKEKIATMDEKLQEVLEKLK